MRLSRVKPPGGVFHCLSRIVGGQYLLGDDGAKEVFRKQMWGLSEFCGIEMITYTILDNHFHLLCQVPERIELNDEQLIERVVNRFGKDSTQARQLEKCLKARGDLSPALREKFLRRMGDVSQFMKELKQGFTIWYNKKHERFGTLWAERFKSVVIEPVTRDLQAVAAYIDLNAVRAGMVNDPKDYRFCGYAEALAQEGKAREGLSGILQGKDWTEKAAAYRMELFGRAAVSRSEGKRTLSREEVLEVMKKGGKLEMHELLRLRVRYFTRGVVLGSREYVEAIFEKHRRKYFPKAKEVARPVPGMEGYWILRLRNWKASGYG
jgi:putative transposase